MTYGPEDLRKAADELLGDFQPSPILRQRILSACSTAVPAASRRKRQLRTSACHWATIAAAGLLVCAVSAIGLSFGLGGGRNPQGEPAAAPNGAQVQAVLTSTAPDASDRFKQMGAAVDGQNENASHDGASAQAKQQIVVSGPEGQCIYYLLRGDNGLYGVADSSGLWIVLPQYDLAYLKSDGTLALISGTQTTLLNTSELAKINP
jgi:hypothetical protein